MVSFEHPTSLGCGFGEPGTGIAIGFPDPSPCARLLPAAGVALVGTAPAEEVSYIMSATRLQLMIAVGVLVLGYLAYVSAQGWH
jgi:hypothetical protein